MLSRFKTFFGRPAAPPPTSTSEHVFIDGGKAYVLAGYETDMTVKDALAKHSLRGGGAVQVITLTSMEFQQARSRRRSGRADDPNHTRYEARLRNILTKAVMFTSIGGATARPASIFM